MDGDNQMGTYLSVYFSMLFTFGFHVLCFLFFFVEFETSKNIRSTNASRPNDNQFSVCTFRQLNCFSCLFVARPAHISLLSSRKLLRGGSVRINVNLLWVSHYFLSFTINPKIAK